MKKMKWIVEFRVSQEWVEDGFNLTEEKALDMLSTDLRFVNMAELGAKILKAPSVNRIRQLQGLPIALKK